MVLQYKVICVTGVRDAGMLWQAGTAGSILLASCLPSPYCCRHGISISRGNTGSGFAVRQWGGVVAACTRHGMGAERGHGGRVNCHVLTNLFNCY